jgi:hypothetical protein
LKNSDEHFEISHGPLHSGPPAQKQQDALHT